MPVQTQMQVRRGTASSWTSTNPTLAAGELGFETDTGKFKIGNGSSTWTALLYAGGGQSSLTTYQYTATAAQTTFSGVDANGNTLAYTVGAVQVYLNGALLQNTADYAATNGTSVVLTAGALVGDSLTIISFATFDVANTYTQAQADALFIADTIVDAKGDIIAATAADTVSRLAVGANDTVLTADSSTATGLKWATPSSGGMTLISTTSLTGSTVNITSIPSGYKHLQLIITEAYAPVAADVILRLNNDSGATSYDDARWGAKAGNAYQVSGTGRSSIRFLTLAGTSDSTGRSSITMDILRYTDTTQNCLVNTIGRNTGNEPGGSVGAHYYRNRTAAITEINIIVDGSTFSAGTAYLYGVS
jgi:hypothetical protein